MLEKKDMFKHVTPRGWFVLGLLAPIVFVLVLYGVWEVSSHLWWTGSGYCWASAAVCLNL